MKRPRVGRGTSTLRRGGSARALAGSLLRSLQRRSLRPFERTSRVTGQLAHVLLASVALQLFVVAARRRVASLTLELLTRACVAGRTRGAGHGEDSMAKGCGWPAFGRST